MKKNFLKNLAIVDIAPISLILIILIACVHMWYHRIKYYDYRDDHAKVIQHIHDQLKKNNMEDFYIDNSIIQNVCSDNKDWEVGDELCMDRMSAFIECNRWTELINVNWRRFQWEYRTSKSNPFEYKETIELANKIQSKQESENVINKCNELLVKNNNLNLDNFIQNKNIDSLSWSLSWSTL